MALNIPMPGMPGTGFLQGINSGSSMFSRMIQPQLEREKQAQAERHFQEQLKLSKAAAARAGANNDLQRQIMQQNLLKLQHSNDTRWALQQLQDKLNFIQNLGGSNENNAQSLQPNMMKMLLSQEQPDMFQGQGAIMPEPEAMTEDVQSQGQPNNLSGIDMEAVKRALTYQALGLKAPPQAGFAYTGPARHAIDLSRIKKDFGENSEEYMNAKAEYDAQIDAKKDLRDIRARTKAGLKPGEKEFYDEKTGAPLGKEIPLTAKERESEEGNILFNELYPYVYKGASPFSGEGSIRRMENAAAHYKTDPQARKMFDDFLLSEKMLAATTVNEASTLKAGRTNQTFNRLKESLDAQDIPKFAKKLIKEYQIPPSAQLRAAMRYQKLLSEARTKARKGTPATQKLFYNPEMQAAFEQQGSNKVVVVDPNGKRFETTEVNAANLPEGWSRD